MNVIPSFSIVESVTGPDARLLPPSQSHSVIYFGRNVLTSRSRRVVIIIFPLLLPTGQDSRDEASPFSV